MNSEVVMKFTQIDDSNSDPPTHLLAMLSCARSHTARLWELALGTVSSTDWSQTAH